MSYFNIALLQMAGAGFDQDANLAKGDAFCRRAANMGADLALFPEMWNIGYEFYDKALAGDLERWKERAIGQDSAFFRHFQGLAQELSMAIAITYLERWPGRPRNSVSVIDRHGQVILTYAKVHTCEFDVECACMPGDGFHVAELDTAKGPVRVGAMICYDREFPESARILMLKGAEVILTPNACGLEQNRLAQFRVRSMENMVAAAMTNYAAPQNNGHSVIFDGAAFGRNYGEDFGASRDMLVIEAGMDEGVYLGPVDLDALRAYRRDEAWGNAYRRPRLYHELVSEEVKEPFVRGDATR
jgi:N-carbamoylputrescine amidase